MATQSFGVTVIRADDLLLLRLELVDVDVTPPAGGLPATVNGRTGARLVVHFQPQHVAEQAFWQSGAATPTKAEQDVGTTGAPATPTPNDTVVPPRNVQPRKANRQAREGVQWRRRFCGWAAPVSPHRSAKTVTPRGGRALHAP